MSSFQISFSTTTRTFKIKCQSIISELKPKPVTTLYVIDMGYRDLFRTFLNN